MPGSARAGKPELRGGALRRACGRKCRRSGEPGTAVPGCAAGMPPVHASPFAFPSRLRVFA